MLEIGLADTEDGLNSFVFVFIYNIYFVYISLHFLSQCEAAWVIVHMFYATTKIGSGNIITYNYGSTVHP